MRRISKNRSGLSILGKGGGRKASGGGGGGKPSIAPTAKKKGGRKPKSENGTVKDRRKAAKAAGVKGVNKLNAAALKDLGF